MKKDIHPSSEEKNVKCSCGSKISIISTYEKSKDMSVGVCSKCHPFYTGKRRLLDQKGRVDKFNKKREMAK